MALKFPVNDEILACKSFHSSILLKHLFSCASSYELCHRVANFLCTLVVDDYFIVKNLWECPRTRGVGRYGLRCLACGNCMQILSTVWKFICFQRPCLLIWNKI
ncbi:hypothetical protein M758_8G195200 [Ceratodon purpureus]|nr:hypothetical protein M758_8G195200 [Ceratodon purpureus]